MIELTFGDSPAGAVKAARAFTAPGPVAAGGEPRTGRAPDGCAPVLFGRAAPLELSLDIGPLSDMDTDLTARKQVLLQLSGGQPGQVEPLWAQTLQAMSLLQNAGHTGESVRVWAGPSDPAELCGLYYACYFLENADIPLSVVWVPRQVRRGGVPVPCRSTGELLPEEFVRLAAETKQISLEEKSFYAREWSRLAAENAPLRAVVNGALLSVPVDFYDSFLRANLPSGSFCAAELIGKTLRRLPGVGDRWLFLRLAAMIRAGELEETAPPDSASPYSGILRRRRGAAL